MNKNVKYSEPKDYIPKGLRKEFGLGEYNKENQEKSKKEREKENEELRKVFKGK